MVKKMIRKFLLVGLMLGAVAFVHPAANPNGAGFNGSGNREAIELAAVATALPFPENLIEAARTGNLMLVRHIVEQRSGFLFSVYNFYYNLLVEGDESYASNAVDHVSQDGMSALCHAAANGHLDVVRYLIEQKVNLNVRDNQDRNTALICAVRNGHMRVAQELIAARAQLNHANKNGQTALLIGAENGDVEIIKALIAAKVHVDSTDQYGRSALIVAAEGGHDLVVEQLLAVGATQDVIATDVDTALACASQHGHIAVVRRLLADSGLHHDRANMYDNTALTYASGFGHTEIARMIIDAYYRSIGLCPVIGSVTVRSSCALIEERLPLECGQMIASLLSLEDILALRCVSTHCLLYADHKFKIIVSNRIEQVKEPLIKDIQHAIAVTPQYPKLKKVLALLRRELEKDSELKKSANLSLLAARVAEAEQWPVYAIAADELSEDLEYEPSEDSDENIAGPAPRAHDCAVAQQQAESDFYALWLEDQQREADGGQASQADIAADREIIERNEREYGEGLVIDQRVAQLREQIAVLTRQAREVNPENNVCVIAPENYEIAHAIYQQIGAAHAELIGLFEPDRAQDEMFVEVRLINQRAQQAAFNVVQQQLAGIAQMMQEREDAANQPQSIEELRARRVAALDRNNGLKKDGEDKS